MVAVVVEVSPPGELHCLSWCDRKMDLLDSFFFTNAFGSLREAAMQATEAMGVIGYGQAFSEHGGMEMTGIIDSLINQYGDDWFRLGTVVSGEAGRGSRLIS